jgi:hypothetical protein
MGEENTVVSVKISITKGIKNAIQVIIGTGLSYLFVNLESKYGIKIDQNMQMQVTIGLAAVVSGALHGIHNWVEHKWPNLKI